MASNTTAGIVILMVSIASAVALLTYAVGSAGGSVGGGGSGGQLTKVCDMRGELGGTVRDINEPITGYGVKDITGWYLKLDKEKCREEVINQSWFDSLFMAGPNSYIPQKQEQEPKPLALIGPGSVTIYVKIYDPEGELVKSKEFTVTTESGESVKDFSEPLLFKSMEQGATFTVKVYHKWKGSEEPAYVQNFEV